LNFSHTWGIDFDLTYINLYLEEKQVWNCIKHSGYPAPLAAASRLPKDKLLILLFDGKSATILDLRNNRAHV